MRCGALRRPGLRDRRRRGANRRLVQSPICPKIPATRRRFRLMRNMLIVLTGAILLVAFLKSAVDGGATTPTGPYAETLQADWGLRRTTTSPRMARSRRHISPAKMDSLCIAGVFYSCPTLRVVPYTTDMISPNRGTGRTIGS